jgi:hypothetical protein
MAQSGAVLLPLLIIVAKAVTELPTIADRLSGSTAATSGDEGGVPWLNVAPTDCAVFSVTIQVPTPLQAPPQLVKLQPDAGDCTRLATVPAANVAEHVVALMPQSMPGGELVTVPSPVADTVRVGGEAFEIVTLTAFEAMPLVTTWSVLGPVSMSARAGNRKLAVDEVSGATEYVLELVVFR